MDPELSDDQRLLLDATESFIKASLPLARVRELIEAGDGTGVAPGPAYRATAAGLGWFAFLAPEELGGGGVSGDGLRDAAIFAELRGRYLQPGNFIDTNVVVSALDGRRLGPAAGRGAARAGGRASRPPPGRWPTRPATGRGGRASSAAPTAAATG